MSDQSEADGVWIFISHSNLDLRKVRKIRDALENDGHKPLLFFLKSLQNGDARLPQLIRDEINARTWFVLCDSDHSRASNWVQEEVAIVTSTKPKETFVTIDLAKDLDVDHDGDVPLFVRKLRPLLKRATVFLSYARSDAVIARQIYDALVEQDYLAFLDVSAAAGFDDWLTTAQTALEDATERGFVLLLLSPDYLTSEWCKLEREWALKALGERPVSNIVPVIVRDPPSVYSQLPADLQNLQCIDTTKGSIVQNITALLHHLKTRPMT
jgi:hypothetical protein